MVASFKDLLGQMPAIADAVNSFDSEATKKQALTALLDAFFGHERDLGDKVDQSQDTPPLDPAPTQPGAGKSTARKAGKKATRSKKSTRARKVASPSIVRDLNLRPDGKTSFRDFAAEKSPQNLMEKDLVAVYYLTKSLGLSGVTVDHVYTCYDEMGWKAASDPRLQLQKTASKQAWLETSNMDDITVPFRGKQHVEHDMPATAESDDDSTGVE